MTISNSIELREQVQAEIKEQWAVFTQEHPNLAAVLDQNLLVEQAVQSIAQDMEYQQAMASAQAIGAAADAGIRVVRRLLTRWLWSLV